MLALAIGSVVVFGLNVGIDFTGGTLVEARYSAATSTPAGAAGTLRPAQEQVENTLADLGVTGASVRAAGEDSYIIRTPVLSDEQRGALEQVLTVNDAYAVSIERFNEVGPIIGQELRNKALVALALVMLAIILYVAFTFRHVSKPVSSWYYGGIAILALLHDVIVPVGAFAIFGALLGAQVDTLFVMALLAILGYSVNDTIVVFDRIREKMQERHSANLFDVFNTGINETLSRTLMTSGTTLTAIGVMYLFGGVGLSAFALILLIGIMLGTYSSIFIASALVYTYLQSRGITTAIQAKKATTRVALPKTKKPAEPAAGKSR